MPSYRKRLLSISQRLKKIVAELEGISPPERKKLDLAPICSHCGARDIVYRKKSDSFRCNRCGNITPKDKRENPLSGIDSGSL